MPTRFPRVNVVVSEEQHRLLTELAALDPQTRSASSFLRQLLDQVTPLLRNTVPMMRAASEEMDAGRSQLREPIRNFVAAIDQFDLLEQPLRRAARTERSDGVRPKRRGRKST
jgi:ABC-type transporter Mla subunit MlaD